MFRDDERIQCPGENKSLDIPRYLSTHKSSNQFNSLFLLYLIIGIG